MQYSMIFKTVLVAILVQQVSSLLCCKYGTVPELAGHSCHDIVHLSPGCRGMSGMYWIKAINGSTVQVYCDMVSLGGGWERLIYYNSSTNRTCPNDMYPLSVETNEGELSQHLCANNYGNSINNITSTGPLYSITSSYSEVMGLMTAYISQPGQGFYPNGRTNNFIDLNTVYAEGLSLVANDTSTGILKHIHTVTISDLYNQDQSQSCFSYRQYSSIPPAIIGRDNTCTIATQKHYLNNNTTNSSRYTLGNYSSSFGAAGNGVCENFSVFCQSPSQYFRKVMPMSLNSSIYSLMVRVSSRSDVIIGINFIDIYVR